MKYCGDQTGQTPLGSGDAAEECAAENGTRRGWCRSKRSPTPLVVEKEETAAAPIPPPPLLLRVPLIPPCTLPLATLEEGSADIIGGAT